MRVQLEEKHATINIWSVILSLLTRSIMSLTAEEQKNKARGFEHED